MDVLDILITDEVPLAIETINGPVSHVHYYEGRPERGAVLDALRTTREAAGYDEVVCLTFLAQPTRGEHGWQRLNDIRL